MKRNFDLVFKKFNGNDIQDGDALNEGITAALTLKATAVNSLMFSHEADKTTSGEEKLKRYLLATRINAGGMVEVSSEEISLLKMLIGRTYPTLVVGQALLFLEQDVIPTETTAKDVVLNATVTAENCETVVGVQIR